jgi:hypothetical protein
MRGNTLLSMTSTTLTHNLGRLLDEGAYYLSAYTTAPMVLTRILDDSTGVNQLHDSQSHGSLQ